MMRRTVFRAVASSTLCLILAVLFHACTEDSVLRSTNEAPDTWVQASSPREEDGGFAVDFGFGGSDPDGRVDSFQWRLLSESSEAQPWTRTHEHVLTLFFPDDPGDFDFENSGPSRIFQIRAVDENGLADPTAAVVDFTPLTLRPEIQLTLPGGSSVSCKNAGRTLTFHWTATDADSKSGAPEFIRYMLKPVQSPSGNCLLRYEFESNLGLYVHPDDPLWSWWIPYDSPDGAGQHVTFQRWEYGEKLLFVVQARDIDGATSRTFDWLQQVVHVQISPSRYPLLIVDETALGQESVVGLNNNVAYDIAAGQELNFSWTADASEYFGQIDGYRYGWDVVDPYDPNDSGWVVDWSDWTSAPTQVFGEGTHNFVLLVRDDSDSWTRLIYQLTVVGL